MVENRFLSPRFGGTTRATSSLGHPNSMKLTYLSETFFPFLVPQMDSSFASSVGPQTVYPAGFSLDEALQIYWRAQNYQLVASGNGVLGPLTQALSVDGLLPATQCGASARTVTMKWTVSRRSARADLCDRIRHADGGPRNGYDTGERHRHQWHEYERAV